MKRGVWEEEVCHQTSEEGTNQADHEITNDAKVGAANHSCG